MEARTERMDIPSDLAARWELIVHETGKRLFTTRNKIREAIGKRPYKGLPVSDEELYNRWLGVRADKTLLTTVIKDNIKETPDGRKLVPNAFVEQILKAEKRAKEGGY
jgi:hypothetical protein